MQVESPAVTTKAAEDPNDISPHRRVEPQSWLSHGSSGVAGLLPFRKAPRVVEEAHNWLGHIDRRTPVASLLLEQQQMLTVAKATMIRPKISILDEATSSLHEAEKASAVALELHHGEIPGFGSTAVLSSNKR